jgi:hypothetical protein
MDIETIMKSWNPIEGVNKKKRKCNGINTRFSKKRADHRNAILKDWADSLESIIEPKVPDNYVSPFDANKCIYCLSSNIGSSGDEFRPSSQRGRQNIINCVPCCGMCNSSKQDKCGKALIQWICTRSPVEQQEKIIKWYYEYESYMIIPLNTYDNNKKQTYEERENGLDELLNAMYEQLA